MRVFVIFNFFLNFKQQMIISIILKSNIFYITFYITYFYITYIHVADPCGTQLQTFGNYMRGVQLNVSLDNRWLRTC